MANLSDLLKARTDQLELNESNLDEGRIYAFADGNMYSPSAGNFFCWEAPDTGVAKIEMWGAGGSGAMQCCCGTGLPGNPGAYSKRCICVISGCVVCGVLGRSCSNADALCFRGCSEPTQLCWFGRTRAGAGEDGCMCAQGGRGGVSYCMDGGSPYCCFIKCGHCGTSCCTCCGLICNYGEGIVGDGNREIVGCCAEAYGGDVNCRGGFSCSSFRGCLPDCVCQHHHHIAIPPGIFAEEGAVVTFSGENNNDFQHWTGNFFTQFTNSLNAAARSPTRGTPAKFSCWNSVKACGNNQMLGCINIMPYGVGGFPAAPCDNSRSTGARGGLGAVRITFYKDRTR